MCLITLSLLLCYKSEAASIPLKYSSHYPLADSAVKKNFILDPSVFTPYKKGGFIKKLQYRLLQKKLAHLSRHVDEGTAPKKNLLSTIALLLGIIASVSLFISAIAGIALIAAPAALVTGIIALGKRYNNSKASRTKAIIAIVLGSVIIFLALLAIILIASSGWGWMFMAG
jgi:hypothetical protein